MMVSASMASRSASGRLTASAGYLPEIPQIPIPGIVRHRIFPCRRFRRPHLRKHLVIGQPLGAVTAAKPVDIELAVAAIDFERECIFPFGAAGVKKRDLSSPPSSAAESRCHRPAYPRNRSRRNHRLRQNPQETSARDRSDAVLGRSIRRRPIWLGSDRHSRS